MGWRGQVCAETRSRALLESARAQQSRVRYEEVLATVARALSAGDADRPTLVSLYRLQGESYAVLGLEADAVAAFRKALELQPNLSLTADAAKPVVCSLTLRGTGPRSARRSAPESALPGLPGREATLTFLASGVLSRDPRHGAFHPAQARLRLLRAVDGLHVLTLV